jgi:DNA-binding GntR family transcriptional regulator
VRNLLESRGELHQYAFDSPSEGMNVAPSINRPEPPYLQVVRYIRDQIASGELRDGDTVPSARQIMQEWDISMATAMKVLATLRAEGLVRGVSGVGTVVTSAENAHHTAQDRFAAIRLKGRIYPPDERAKIESAEVVRASEQIADALGVQAGETVIRRHRVTYRGDIPVSASVSWFHGSLAEAAPRLLKTARITEGTPRYIEQMTGKAVTSGRDQLSAASADEQEAASLSIQAGSAVLRGRNWFYGAAGEVIEYGESVAVAGRWASYEYLVRRD